MNLAIIGSGIVGLTSAWRCAEAGCKVTTFDGNRESKEASWTAAGMLAPHNEANDASELWKLCHSSLQRWQSIPNELGISPRDLDLHHKGSLIPIFHEEERVSLEHKITSLTREGVDFEWITPNELQTKEPALSGDLLGAYSLEGGHVDPRKACWQLQKKCRSLGVQQHFETSIVNIKLSEHGCVELSLNNGEKHSYDHVLIASGAWTPFLANMTGIELQGEPVKGQMIRFEHHGGTALNKFIHCEHAYAVPRSDGSVVVGSTMENCGFDKSDNQTSIEQLKQGATRLMPQLKDIKLSETWTGLRPKLKDGLPLFQKFSKQLTVASGHFRNGILLAPITGEIVRDIILDKDSPHHLVAFQWA